MSKSYCFTRRAEESKRKAWRLRWISFQARAHFLSSAPLGASDGAILARRVTERQALPGGSRQSVHGPESQTDSQTGPVRQTAPLLHPCQQEPSRGADRTWNNLLFFCRPPAFREIDTHCHTMQIPASRENVMVSLFVLLRFPPPPNSAHYCCTVRHKQKKKIVSGVVCVMVPFWTQATTTQPP